MSSSSLLFVLTQEEHDQAAQQDRETAGRAGEQVTKDPHDQKS